MKFCFRSFEAKRVLVLDDNKKLKRQKLLNDDEKDDEKVSRSAPDEHKKTEKQKSSSEVIVPQNVTKNDLHALKRKIFEIRQELDCLKSREQCTKKVFFNNKLFVILKMKLHPFFTSSTIPKI